MENDDERIAAILEKFAGLTDDAHVIIFTESEAQVLRKFANDADLETLLVMISSFSSLRGAVRVGGWLGSTLKWFLLISAGLVAVKSGLLGWITTGIGK